MTFSHKGAVYAALAAMNLSDRIWKSYVEDESVGESVDASLGFYFFSTSLVTTLVYGLRYRCIFFLSNTSIHDGNVTITSSNNFLLLAFPVQL